MMASPSYFTEECSHFRSILLYDYRCDLTWSYGLDLSTLLESQGKLVLTTLISLISLKRSIKESAARELKSRQLYILSSADNHQC